MAGGGGGGSYYGGGGGGGSGGGGGGGGGAGGFGGDDGGRDQCELTVQATIHSPNSDYANALTLGTVLNVVLGGESGRTLEVRTVQNYLVGSLVGLTNAGLLIACIQAGNVYQAEIRQVSSGTYGVLVTRTAST